MYHIDFFGSVCAVRNGVICVLYGYATDVTVTTNGQKILTVPSDCKPKVGITLVATYVDGAMVTCSLSDSGELKMWGTTFSNKRVNIPALCYPVA